MGCSGRYVGQPWPFGFFSWVHDPKDEASHRCEEYWNRVSHLPFYKKLVIKNPGKTIPLSWHMDGVKVYKTHKVWAYSHSSAIRKGQSIDTKTLFLLFRDSDMVKPHTHDAVAKLIAYTMDVLQSGVFPDKDVDGNSFRQNSKEAKRAGSYFAGGWCAAFACFKADLEGRVMAHKLVRNWASDSICEHCLASKLPQCSYGDFTNAAAYWECMLTHEQYLMLNPPGKTSAWTSVRGWDITRNLDESCQIVSALLFWIYLSKKMVWVMKYLYVIWYAIVTLFFAVLQSERICCIQFIKE